MLLVVSAAPRFLWNRKPGTPPRVDDGGARRLSRKLQDALDLRQVGFYIQVFKEPREYVAEMLAGIRYFYPASPMVLLSDHGARYDDLCEIYECKFVFAKESLNVDRGRSPHSFTCEAFMGRVVDAIKSNGVRWTFYWESDTRATSLLTRAPTHDLMQMFSEHNHFDRFRVNGKKIIDMNLTNTINALFPQLGGTVIGWSSTGGTIFDGQKLIRAIDNATIDGFYRSYKWTTLMKPWFNLPDTTSDLCLEASAFVAGMTVGKWDEYGELRRMQPQSRWHAFVACVHGCQDKFPRIIPWQVSLEPPDLDVCIFNSCWGLAVVHNVKVNWANFERKEKPEPSFSVGLQQPLLGTQQPVAIASTTSGLSALGAPGNKTHDYCAFQSDGGRSDKSALVLERHTENIQHGDVCRDPNQKNAHRCPHTCQRTVDASTGDPVPPYCESRSGGAGVGQYSQKQAGRKTLPCRVPGSSE